MGSLQKLIPSLMYLLVVFPGLVILQDNPNLGFNGAERDALLALREGFNNPPSLKNWTSLQCYLNDTPAWDGIQCLNGRVVGIALEGLGLTGQVSVHALVNLTELSGLSFRNNSISGNVMDFSSNPKLTRIDLSGNIFEGTISNSLVNLHALQSLQLQDNNLTGEIPEFSQTTLTVFNVSNNNLFGEIPQADALRMFNFSSYFGNPGLCGPPSLAICDGTSAENAKKKKKFLSGAPLIAIIVVLDVLVLAIVVPLVVFYYKKMKKNKKLKKEMKIEEERRTNDKRREENLHGENRAVARQERTKLTFVKEEGGFELGDLLKASAEGLGKGNFANTYKASLENGAEVVVKRLRDLKPLTSEEFTKHMRVFADLKHPNLLSLLAYYYSKDEKLLVYRFVHNGNLFNRLHEGRGENRVPFKWNARLLVAQSVARALEYLHNNTTSQTIIPHGNLKSSNVLFDENGTIVVSDYGLASLIAIPIATQHMTSYKAPEFQHRKKLTKKADIWTYGSLLLEILTGRVSICSVTHGTNGLDLCSWVHRAVREEWTAEIFDSEISVQRNASEGMLRLLQIAVRCCNKLPEKRPNIEDVVRELENISICDSEEDTDFSFNRSFTEDSLSTGYDSGKGKISQ